MSRWSFGMSICDGDGEQSVLETLLRLKADITGAYTGFFRHTYHTTSSAASLTGSGSRHFFLPGKLTFPAFLRQYRQCFVLVGLHDLAFSRPFIVDAA